MKAKHRPHDKTTPAGHESGGAVKTREFNDQPVAVVLLSGGVDSTTLLYDTIVNGYQVVALSFEYGQKHSREISAAIRTCYRLKIPHRIIPFPLLGELAPSAITKKSIPIPVPEGGITEGVIQQTTVPHRYLVMVSVATAYAAGIEADAVFIPAHISKTVTTPENKEQFIDSLREAVKLSCWDPIMLYAPYIGWDKGDIVTRGGEIGVDFGLTWSCIVGGPEPCGVCAACIERAAAFEKAGITDPLAPVNGSA